MRDIEHGAAHGVSEVELLRHDVREVRDLVTGVLVALVGRDRQRISEAACEGSVQGHMLRLIPEMSGAHRHHASLNDVLPNSEKIECLKDRYDLVTLCDLVRELTREQVAAWPGMGPKRMAALDLAVEEAGLAPFWVAALEEAA